MAAHNPDKIDGNMRVRFSNGTEKYILPLTFAVSVNPVQIMDTLAAEDMETRPNMRTYNACFYEMRKSLDIEPYHFLSDYEHISEKVRIFSCLYMRRK